MTYEDFFNLLNGALIDEVDPDNHDQCFDLAVAWCMALGLPRSIFSGLVYAKDIFKNPTQITKDNFTLIPNSPTAVPQEGDVIVFDGAVGHVSVGTKRADTNTFDSFDQNWGPQACHIVTHNYDNPKVLGWLRFKGTMPVPDNDCAVKLIAIIAERDRLNGIITGKDNTIASLNQQIINFNSQLQTLQVMISNKDTQLLNNKEVIDGLTVQANKVIDLTNQVNDLTDSVLKRDGEIATLKTQNGTLTTNMAKLKALLIPKKYLSLQLYKIAMALG
jgi:hypothetical protein